MWQLLQQIGLALFGLAEACRDKQSGREICFFFLLPSLLPPFMCVRVRARTPERKGWVLPQAEQLRAARVVHASIFVHACVCVCMPTKRRAALTVCVCVGACVRSSREGGVRGICRPCAGQREARGPQGVSFCRGIPRPPRIFICVCDRIVLLLMTPPPTALLWPAATCFYLDERHRPLLDEVAQQQVC